MPTPLHDYTLRPIVIPLGVGPIAINKLDHLQWPRGRETSTPTARDDQYFRLTLTEGPKCIHDTIPPIQGCVICHQLAKPVLKRNLRLGFIQNRREIRVLT